MKKTILKSALVALAGLGLMAGSAMAVPLVGGISFTEGAITVLDSNNQVTENWSTATMIVFDDGIIEVHDRVGDFLLIVGDKEEGTMNPLQFVPPTLANPLWTFGDLSFNLTGMDVRFQSSTNLIIDGMGTFFSDNYDPTPGTWNFSANNAGSGGTSYTSSWSLSQATAPVPEPATMLLFGTGLAGLAGIARRKKK